MNKHQDAESALERLAMTHYENFPVASRFIPRRYRRPIHLIYAFARTGDDIADEWPDPKEERLRALEEWFARLQTAVEKNQGTAFFMELASVIRTYGLDLQLFADLITAFRMDICHNGYRTYHDLLGYCRYSANPVGRLMLQVFGSVTEENYVLSDAFCTALQLANFWQDLFIDTARGRCYIPDEDYARFGIDGSKQSRTSTSEALRTLMKFEVERTRQLFSTASPLPQRVSASLGFELKLIWHGGMRILEKIERGGYDTLASRPALGMADKMLIAYRACVFG